MSVKIIFVVTAETSFKGGETDPWVVGLIGRSDAPHVVKSAAASFGFANNFPLEEIVDRDFGFDGAALIIKSEFAKIDNDGGAGDFAFKTT